MESDFNFLIANSHQYLVWALVVACLALLIWLIRWRKQRKEIAQRRIFLQSVFDAAIKQKAPFDLRLRNSESRSGLSAVLQSLSTKTLDLTTPNLPVDEWHKEQVEVFLRLNQDNGPVFYVFESVVRSISRQDGKGEISIAIPAHLRVDKKRRFIRAIPRRQDILMIAVWPAEAGRRLPRSTTEAGKPIIAWKNGDSQEKVQVENISGGGLALRFQLPQGESWPFNPEKGQQLVCLLVYASEEGNPVIFWSSGEIMSVRKAGHTIVLGLEFTNWAIQEQGSTEIHWTHSSPCQGAKPLLDWIKRIEKD